MKAEKDDGYRCPRCDDHIPEQFYCRDCGYVPDWRQIELYEGRREAAYAGAKAHGEYVRLLVSRAAMFGIIPSFNQ